MHRRRPAGVLTRTLLGCAAGGLLWLACGDDELSSPDMPDPGGMMPPITRVEPRSAQLLTAADRPTAAVLDRAGKKVYFIAHDDSGPQLYSHEAKGGVTDAVPTSPPLSAPVALAIAPDDSALFIADPGAGPGGLWRGELAGGTPGDLRALATGEVQVVTAVTVAADGLYLGGLDAEGVAGVWRLPAMGGAATVLVKGAPLGSLAALAHSNEGVLYALDAVSGEEGGAALYRIETGSATRINQTPLRCGFPAGLGPSGPRDLILSSNAPGAAALLRITPTGEATPMELSGDPLSPDGDPGVVHQAANANAWVVLDTATLPQASFENTSGGVYLLAP